MNTQFIHKLANHIETLPHSFYDEGGFSMECYTHTCGSPSCIAGWAIYLSNHSLTIADNGTDGDSLHALAAAILDISDYTANELFTPNLRWADITPRQAATTLRHLAATGSVEWNL